MVAHEGRWGRWEASSVSRWNEVVGQGAGGFAGTVAVDEHGNHLPCVTSIPRAVYVERGAGEQ